MGFELRCRLPGRLSRQREREPKRICAIVVDVFAALSGKPRALGAQRTALARRGKRDLVRSSSFCTGASYLFTRGVNQHHRRARQGPSAGHFHFGQERDGYEAQWTPAAYDRLNAVLDALPIHWRFFAKTEIFRRMEGRSGPDGVQLAFDAVCERFPEQPRPRLLREAAE